MIFLRLFIPDQNLWQLATLPENVTVEMSNLQEMLAMVEQIGLQVKEAVDFIKDQQELARSERIEHGEKAKRQREHEL